MRLQPRDPLVSSRIKALAARKAVDPEGVTILGFDWRERGVASGSIGHPATRAFLIGVNSVSCYRGLLYLGPADSHRRRAHFLDVSGDVVYSVSLDVARESARWVRFDPVVASSLREALTW